MVASYPYVAPPDTNLRASLSTPCLYTTSFPCNCPCACARNHPPTATQGPCRSVPVPVMNVRIMRVRVGHCLMLMRVRVRFVGRFTGGVSMLVMFVVRVPMVVLPRLMPVLLLLSFRQVQPDPATQQQRRNAQSQAQGITEKRDGHRCAHKRRG